MKMYAQYNAATHSLDVMIKVTPGDMKGSLDQLDVCNEIYNVFGRNDLLTANTIGREFLYQLGRMRDDAKEVHSLRSENKKLKELNDKLIKSMGDNMKQIPKWKRKV